jgi:hypothetical protein
LPMERRILLERIEADLAKAENDTVLHHSIVNTICSNPEVDRWIAAMVEGREQFRIGYPDPYLKFVRKTKLEPAEIKSRLQRAYALFLECWKLQPDYPEAAAALIRISASLQTEAEVQTPRFWFDQAVLAEFDHADAYRWLTDTTSSVNNPDELYQFGEECLATERFDTNVPWEFFRIVQKLARSTIPYNMIYRQPGTFENLQTLFVGYSENRGEAYRPYWDSNLACAAWLAGRDDEARAIIDRLGKQVDTTVCQNFLISWGDMKKALYPSQAVAKAGGFGA